MKNKQLHKLALDIAIKNKLNKDKASELWAMLRSIRNNVKRGNVSRWIIQTDRAGKAMRFKHHRQGKYSPTYRNYGMRVQCIYRMMANGWLMEHGA